MALRAYGDGSLFGETSGDGPLQVLALHGWARRGSDFAPSLLGFSFIALDLPGFGATPPPAAAIGAAGYARAIEPVLAEFPDRVVVVGHSFGGRVAVHLAANRPDRIKGLILTGVPLLRREVERKAPTTFRMARWAAKLGLIPASTMERMRRRYGSSDYRAAEGVMRQILVMAVNESYEEQLAQLALPVELLWGADDAEVPVAVAERAAVLLTAAGSEVKVVVEPDVGHLLPVVAPKTLHRAVAEMVGR
jgi:pimeloyl-ACP methyl ester carboxylesterase